MLATLPLYSTKRSGGQSHKTGHLPIRQKVCALQCLYELPLYSGSNVFYLLEAPGSRRKDADRTALSCPIQNREWALKGSINLDLCLQGVVKCSDPLRTQVQTVENHLHVRTIHPVKCFFQHRRKQQKGWSAVLSIVHVLFAF